MKIKYDIQKIKSIISDFSNITGISMALLDTEYNYIAKYEYNSPEFCRRIQDCERGRMLCMQSDKDMLKTCTDEKRFVSHICHAGITDSAMPIVKDGIISGYIILGRVRQDNDFDSVYKNIEWIGDTRSEIEKNYLKISYFNDGQMESISRLVGTILFSDAITIELDVSLASAIEYIGSNLRGDLSISAICKASHTSKNMLYKMFHDTFDCTINDYIIKKRVDAARYMLENSDISVREVGESVGVDNPAHFCRMFKRQIGVSPTSYRNSFRVEN